MERRRGGGTERRRGKAASLLPSVSPSLWLCDSVATYISEAMMKMNLRLVVLLLFCVAAPSGCRRAESYQKPAKPVQTQEAQRYYPGGEPGAGERYSANILPSSQTELAFKHGGYLSEIHQVKGADNKMR